MVRTYYYTRVFLRWFEIALASKKCQQRKNEIVSSEVLTLAQLQCSYADSQGRFFKHIQHKLILGHHQASPKRFSLLGYTLYLCTRHDIPSSGLSWASIAWPWHAIWRTGGRLPLALRSRLPKRLVGWSAPFEIRRMLRVTNESTPWKGHGGHDSSGKFTFDKLFELGRTKQPPSPTWEWWVIAAAGFSCMGSTNTRKNGQRLKEQVRKCAWPNVDLSFIGIRLLFKLSCRSSNYVPRLE